MTPFLKTGGGLKDYFGLFFHLARYNTFETFCRRLLPGDVQDVKVQQSSARHLALSASGDTPDGRKISVLTHKSQKNANVQITACIFIQKVVAHISVRESMHTPRVVGQKKTLRGDCQPPPPFCSSTSSASSIGVSCLHVSSWYTNLKRVQINTQEEM